MAISGEAIRLDVALRGSRDYLHSTTIFEAIVRHLQEPTEITLVIRRLIVEPLLLTVVRDRLDVVGEFACIDRGEPIHFFLCPDRDAPSPRRAASNEADIVDAATLRGGSISGAIGAPGTFIETVVDLHKRLIEATLQPGVRLLFSRLVTRHVPKSGVITITNLQRLGARMFVAPIACDGEALGRVAFMGVAP